MITRIKNRFDLKEMLEQYLTDKSKVAWLNYILFGTEIPFDGWATTQQISNGIDFLVEKVIDENALIDLIVEFEREYPSKLTNYVYPIVDAKLAILTQNGAKRLERDAWELLTYEHSHPLNIAVTDLRTLDGELVAYTLAFDDDEPSVVIFGE